MASVGTSTFQRDYAHILYIQKKNNVNITVVYVLSYFIRLPLGTSITLKTFMIPQHFHLFNRSFSLDSRVQDFVRFLDKLVSNTFYPSLELLMSLFCHNSNSNNETTYLLSIYEFYFLIHFLLYF